ncbi:MAG: triose-phosphate isomerase [Chlamydiota bacterium]
MAKKYIMAGNWKMYKTIDEAVGFIEKLRPLVEDTPHKVYLGVPFTAIKPAAEKAHGSPIVIGAQNMNDASEGGFTGEIAGKMLVDAGAQFVILGHSERRQYFFESDDFINKKVKKALLDGLEVILCVGETLEERQDGKTQEVLKNQIIAGLQGISADELSKVILAYEPIWAIGTGETATPDVAQDNHHYCRQQVKEQWGDKVAAELSILYGGSVKPANVDELMRQDDIDGALVGGASLDPETFSKITNFGDR